MQLSALQIVLLVLVAAEINVDRRGLSLTHARPVIVGFLCGLILGDMNSGLYIGGTFTLMSLGVAALGGSSVPDYGVATIIACAFAKTTGQGPEVGMTIGLPVGMLGVQMDVLYKICNSFIAQKSQKYANEKQFGKMYANPLPLPCYGSCIHGIPNRCCINSRRSFSSGYPGCASFLGNRRSVCSRKAPSWSWYCHAAPLHAGKEVLQLHSDRLCTQRIHGRTDPWYRIPWCSFSLQVLYG